MLKRLLIGFVVLVVLIGALLSVPSTHTAERSRLIAASPAAIHAQVETPAVLERLFPKHNARDGSSTFEGPASGVGAQWKWKTVDGAEHSLRVSESSLERVTLELQASNPASQTVRFLPEGQGTRVTWTHAVTLSGWQKLIPLFRSVDAVMGPDLEKVLSDLAASVEGKTNAK